MTHTSPQREQFEKLLKEILEIVDVRATDENTKSVRIGINKREEWFPYAHARDQLRSVQSEIKSAIAKSSSQTPAPQQSEWHISQWHIETVEMDDPHEIIYLVTDGNTTLATCDEETKALTIINLIRSPQSTTAPEIKTPDYAFEIETCTLAAYLSQFPLPSETHTKICTMVNELVVEAKAEAARAATLAADKEIKVLKYSLDFYKRRCEEIEKIQSQMRDPERQAICDILANGFLLTPFRQNATAEGEP